MSLADTGHLAVNGAALEYRMIGPRPDAAPTFLMLHEGLGSVSTWGTFPEQLAQRTGAGVFVYSRAGYGKSSTITLPRPLDYMQREATEVLPGLLDMIGFTRGILLGHSDGATIAACYAGSVQDHRVRGLVLMAPHFFTEPEGLAEICNARLAYETTDLRARLARHHADVDAAFRGWNEAWLDPGFAAFDTTDALAYIRVPVLVMQGAADPYGTLAQVRVVEEECYCPVEAAVLPGVGHAPHREQPEQTLAAVAAFADRIFCDGLSAA
ncbi:MAG: alpha/beta hydrolase [Alphaproteobacteria bacterium]|nr:MAG: alpha/beta hydrolase [Alphaproteobacteria bacterium]